MGLDTPPALGGAGERDGRGGRSPPTRGGLRWAERRACRGVIGGSAPLPPGRLATLAAVRLPYIVGEVAALRCGRRGAEGLRFFGKIRKPPTPLRRLLRRRHLPCTAGEAWVLPQLSGASVSEANRGRRWAGLFDTGMTTRNKRKAIKDSTRLRLPPKRFSLESEGFLLAQAKEISQNQAAGPCPASRPPPRSLAAQFTFLRLNNLPSCAKINAKTTQGC